MLRLALVVVVACSSGDGRDVAAKQPPTPRAVHPIDAGALPPHAAAIGDTSYLAADLQRAFDPHDDFAPMPAPGPHDWLAQHKETPQTYDDFARASTNVPTPQRHTIYILPIGEFPATAPSLDALVAITHAFFTLDVRVLPRAAIADLTAKTRINADTRKRQLLAPDVLAWLAKRVPDDAFALMAVTMEDLYPQESWNFVFGMASLSERVGVQSFARQDPAFFGEPRAAGWKQLALRRATWTLVHEISHMFGLPHCTYWTCVVAGSNHQAEADARPLHPCPVCLRKLYSVIRFDPAQREAELAKVLRELDITDEATWSERRAGWIRDAR